MKIAELEFPDDLYYDTNHQWIAVQDDQIAFGLTDYAQSTAGDVVFLELPPEGAQVQVGQPIGSIESGKWVGRLYAPVDGTVVAVNVALRNNTRLINRDPYGQGWIARLKPSSPEKLDGLMQGERFATFIREEIARDQALEGS